MHCSTQTRGAASSSSSLCSALLALCLLKAETSQECICGETLALGFLAVGQFLMAQDHHSSREQQTAILAPLFQPYCVSQLLFSAEAWLFCCDKPCQLAQSFFFSRFEQQPNKCFPA